jgi:hypothetical protein
MIHLGVFMGELVAETDDPRGMLDFSEKLRL